jgi:hypothetical protein
MEEMLSFKSWKLGLALVSAILLIESAMAAQYVFTVFTSASESNMNVYTSTDATNLSILKADAYVRILLLRSSRIS